MVKGLDRFKEYFAPYSDSYLLIGGTACFLVMKEVGLDFRSTKDLDIVLCLESLHPNFSSVIWEFVKQGQYSCLQKSSGKRQFYRFHSPCNVDYPYMLELFSRKPDVIKVPKDFHLTPIPFGVEISSLSAILLDPEYYSFLHSGKRLIDGLSILRPEYLILMKVKAWCNYSISHGNGSREAKKHKKDILHLSQLLSPQTRIYMPESVSQDFQCFLNELKTNPPDLKSLNIKNQPLAIILTLLENVYLSCV